MTTPASLTPDDGAFGASAAMGALIRDAWLQGSLLDGSLQDGALQDGALRNESLPRSSPLGNSLRGDSLPTASLPGNSPSPASSAQVRLLGRGESFAAWGLFSVGSDPHPFAVVRVPWRSDLETAQPIGQDFPALTLAASAIAPKPLRLVRDAEVSPIGVPFVATTFVAGRVLAPHEWTTDVVLAHADSLALLHSVELPGRGPLSAAEEPTATLAPGGMSIVGEAQAAFEWWRSEHPQVAAAQENSALMSAALEVCALAEPDFAALDSYVLAHGDACATNVVVDGGADGAWTQQSPHSPVVRFIDFEWSQADDRARDLAIIGGSVVGGRWYVPMSYDTVEQMVRRYADRASELDPGLNLDVASLLRRRDAWVAYERTAMVLHVHRRALEGSGEHARVLPRLRETLEDFLGPQLRA